MANNSFNPEQFARQQQWFNYQLLESPENHLYLVLRWFNDQYVVHLYNANSNDYHYGVYCGDDRTKAERVFAQKLARYRGESQRPDTLMEALSEVRQSGDCNMIDLNCVCHVMTDMGYRDSAVWLNYNRDRYGEVLMELGEWLRDYTQPLEKSLAQELAEAMGWEVIVD